MVIRSTNRQRQYRDLKGKSCPKSRAQEVWYHIKIVIYSKEPISCNSKDWYNIKRFLEKEVKKINLYDDYKISGMKVNICAKISSNRRDRRRHLEQDKNNNNGIGVGGVHENSNIYELDFTDDEEYEYDHDDEDADADDESGVFENDVAMHNSDDSNTEVPDTVMDERMLVGSSISGGVLKIEFNIFFKGGGRCIFCKADNSDYNSRKLHAYNNNNTSANTVHESHLKNFDLSLLDDMNMSPGIIKELKDKIRAIQQDGETQPNKPVASNSQNVQSMEAVVSPVSNSTSNLRGGDAHHRNLQRRCGGCYRLNFHKDKNYETFQGTPRLPIDEYRSSHGVSIRAHPGSGCARSSAGLLLSTRHPQGFVRLGSPNKACGGSGVGNGGKPKLPSGKSNPGANCGRDPSRVLTMTKSWSGKAKPCETGGHFDFEFVYPVKLNEIGLMDVKDNNAIKIEVTFQDQSTRTFRPTGWGENSVETVKFNGLFKVVRMRVTFRSMGGITFLDYCQDCNGVKSDSAILLGLFAGLMGGLGVGDSPSPWYEILSYAGFSDITEELSGAISTELDYAVNRKYRRDVGSCLYSKSFSVHASIEMTTKEEATSCGAN